MPSTYTTKQGDMWDGISKQVYGSEYYMQYLMDANPDRTATVIFDGGITLTVPDRETSTDITNLPPWKRGKS